MRLPGGPALALESLALAEAIAEEWQAAGGVPGGIWRPNDVPLTQLAGTAQEHVARNPGATAAAIAAFAHTDLLCYRATGPQELVARQDTQWQPWLDWTADRFGVRLAVASGVMPVPQPTAAVQVLHEAVAACEVTTLAGLGVLVPALGSLVLGLAVAKDALDATQACCLATLDEAFQAETWGEDGEAAGRQRHLARDVALAARFISLSGRQGKAKLGEMSDPPQTPRHYETS